VDSLTQSQIRRPAKLRDEHIVVEERKGVSVAERPNGRLVQMQPTSKPPSTALLARVQSYLSVERC
jgi:hypothetical protein